MNNFLKLVWNEQIKLYAQKSTWIMIVLIAAIVLGTGLLAKFMGSGIATEEYGADWQTELQEENAALAKEMEEDEFAGFANPFVIQKNEYYLENDIKPLPYDGWEYVLENAALTSLLSLFTIIVAAGIVSNEFKWGTIKLLLIRPISRTKILLSKYVSVLLFALTLLVSMLAASWIVGALLFGLNGASPMIVQETSSGFEQTSVLKEILQGYGFGMVTLVMMATFAFMISTIFRSSGMAIGLAIFLMMAGNALVAFVSQYSWSKYILFANTNLGQYFNGSEPMIEGMTLAFSLSILAIYFFIFLAAAWTAFTKRDIAGN
ncbi:MAG TPA: ABC transporter permease subunit [Planococcus sp. (in: firmicutes)]|nr:ABC transporter permease subunit [Planococcus sp. (in: firmicutes)]